MAVLFHCLARAKRLSFLAVLALFCLGLTPDVKAICRNATALGNGLERQLREEQPSPQQEACTGDFAFSGDPRIGLFVGNDPINYIDPFGLDRIVGWRGGIPIIIKDNPIPGQNPFVPDGRENIGNMIGAEYGKGLAQMAAGEGIGALIQKALSALRVARAAKAVCEWVGPGAKATKPAQGSDLIINSADKTRQIRFDLTDPHGLDPHINVEQWKPRNLYPGDKRFIPDPTVPDPNIHIFPQK